MTEKLKQVIKREMEKLPKENQEAINVVDWGKITEEIGKKYLLNESDLNDFQVQTFLVLIGLEDSDFYPQNIENEVGTSRERAREIAGEVFQKIFTPIADILIGNIKKSEQGKNPDAEQTLNFILSSGNYSVFAKKNTTAPAVPADATKEDIKRVN